jgi:hypothetical protein
MVLEKGVHGNLQADATRGRVDRGQHRGRQFANRTKQTKARFLNMAEGSLEASRYYLIPQPKTWDMARPRS